MPKITPDPFDMFCLYYLGLTPEGEVRFVNANQIAKRFNWTAQAVLDFLRKHRMHPDAVLNTDFPLARYQADLQIAAVGEDPQTLRLRAEMIYESFTQRSGRFKRDWLREIEEERARDREAEHERRMRSKYS